MSKAQFTKMRVLKLSWRPPGPYGKAAIAALVGLLKNRLQVFPEDDFGREIELIDVNEAGRDKETDRAHAREGSWNDFVALYTVDYCIACGEEAEASELAEALQQRGEDGKLLWLLRIDKGDPVRSRVGALQPWKDEHVWRFLPEGSKDPLPTADLAEMDGALEERCLMPLRATDPWAPGNDAGGQP